MSANLADNLTPTNSVRACKIAQYSLMGHYVGSQIYAPFI